MTKTRTKTSRLAALKNRLLTKPGYRLAVIIALILMVHTIEYNDQTTSPSPLPPLTDAEMITAQQLINANSPDPAALARAIHKTKRPRLATAQAIVESNGTPWAVGKVGEKGVWQIIEREWGPVPAEPEGQARKWEEVIEEYLRQSRGNVREALCRYNTGRPDRGQRYAEKVLRELRRMG